MFGVFPVLFICVFYLITTDEVLIHNKKETLERIEYKMGYHSLCMHCGSCRPKSMFVANLHVTLTFQGQPGDIPNHLTDVRSTIFGRPIPGPPVSTDICYSILISTVYSVIFLGEHLVFCLSKSLPSII